VLFWTTVKLALRSLMANKMRSFLSMLGIIIGVGAVISMLALGAGAQARVMEQMSAMGTNLLLVRSGQSGQRGVRTTTAQTLTVEDALAIVDEVPEVAAAAPDVSGKVQAKYLNKNANTTLTGANVPYFDIRNYTVAAGRTFTESEAEGMAKVAVLGADAAKNLFEDADPLGETIKVNGMNFRVVGVLKAKGDQGWFNPDDQVLVPYTTAMKQVLGLDHLRGINVQVADGANVQEAETAVAKVLRTRHRLRPGQEDDFHVRNQAEMLEAASTMTQTFTILLGGIASISLVVGGIGIMNIMLVTVTERTREIGVRKAIGARDRDILRQFLFEALLMSGLGGLMGVAAGSGVSAAISRLTQFGTIIEISSVLLALSFSAGVGIFFGYYPARRAARLNPIESLRYE